MLFSFLLVLGVLLALGMPVAFALGLTMLSLLLIHTDLPLVLLPHQMLTGADNYSLIAVPFFMLAAEIMAAGGITRRIIDFFVATIGWIRGGLALVNVGASMVMASFSGSAVADSSMIGSLMIPAMKNRKYSPEFAAAVTATASTLGVIIPPSIPMIVLGFITGNSVLEMFFGGLVPGLLIGCVLLFTVYLVARISNAPVEDRQSLKEIGHRVRETGWALLLPIIVVGGLRIGLFTITESSVFAVAYALFVAGVIYRELTWSTLYQAGVRASITASVVMFIVSSATGSAWLLSSEQVPQALAETMAGITDSATVFMVLSIAFTLVVGMVMDLTPALLILGPIMVPIATEFGIDPIHYSVVMVIALAYGLITPPVGTCLYLCAGIADVSVTKVIVKTLPMLISAIVVLILIAMFPPLVTWLPSLMH